MDRTHARISTTLTLGATIAALTLTSCTATETPEPSAPAEITVGIVTSESGPLAGSGKQYAEGFRAGIDYATEGTGEVGGTAISVEYRDDGGDPDQAVAAVDELVDDGVTIIAGSASSDVATAVAEKAAQEKIVYIAGSAVADALTGMNDYTFRSGRQRAQDVATAGTVIDDVDGETVIVLAQDTPYGRSNEAEVREVLGAQGATVDSVLVSEEATEFVPFAQQVLAAGPDLVFVAWAGPTSKAMWQGLSAQGVPDAVPVTTALGDVATFAAYGAASEKIRFFAHYFPEGPDNEVNTALIDGVEAAGGTPGLASADGFNAALMVAQAIAGGRGDVDAMIGALEGFEFDGPKGAMTVRASDHALVQDMYQAKLVGADGSFAPELVDTISADEVAPADAG